MYIIWGIGVSMKNGGNIFDRKWRPVNYLATIILRKILTQVHFVEKKKEYLSIFSFMDKKKTF